jgi:hypothetical protein
VPRRGERFARSWSVAATGVREAGGVDLAQVGGRPAATGVREAGGVDLAQVGGRAAATGVREAGGVDLAQVGGRLELDGLEVRADEWSERCATAIENASG